MTISTMNEDLIRRIDEILDRKGVSRSAASKSAGLSESYIRDLEKIKGAPNLGKLAKLAFYLETGLDELIPGASDSPALQVKVEWLQVRGVISAGHFRDITIHSQDEDFATIPMTHTDKYPRDAQYALLVEGDSMNEKYPDGSFVTCVEIGAFGRQPKPGNTLHVERTIGGGQLVETTLKELRIENGQKILYPRSTNPKHKPIPLDGNEGTEIHVKGVVTGSYVPEIF